MPTFKIENTDFIPKPNRGKFYGKNEFLSLTNHIYYNNPLLREDWKAIAQEIERTASAIKAVIGGKKFDAIFGDSSICTFLCANSLHNRIRRVGDDWHRRIRISLSKFSEKSSRTYENVTSEYKREVGFICRDIANELTLNAVEVYTMGADVFVEYCRKAKAEDRYVDSIWMQNVLDVVYSIRVETSRHSAYRIREGVPTIEDLVSGKATFATFKHCEQVQQEKIREMRREYTTATEQLVSSIFDFNLAYVINGYSTAKSVYSRKYFLDFGRHPAYNYRGVELSMQDCRSQVLINSPSGGTFDVEYMLVYIAFFQKHFQESKLDNADLSKAYPSLEYEVERAIQENVDVLELYRSISGFTEQQIELLAA